MDQDQGSQLFGESLAYTPYACMNFERLSGGYTNSTYRGTLAQPLEDGTSTVVIKKAQSIVTPEFSYHARRSVRDISLVFCESILFGLPCCASCCCHLLC